MEKKILGTHKDFRTYYLGGKINLATIIQYLYPCKTCMLYVKWLEQNFLSNQ